MKRLLPLTLLLLACGSAAAQIADPSLDCERAAQTAEVAHGLPTGLLTAIGRVESGRQDPISGRTRPWPWALNAEGAGAWLPNRETAVAAVAALRARGVRSIDIGCFQVNLVHHPDAFVSVEQGFDPGINADYAARFLVGLRQRTGGWARAVMAYHSATIGLGEPYWARVQATWDGTLPPATLPVAIPSGSAIAGVRVWTPSPAGTAPSVIRLGSPDLPYPEIVYRPIDVASKN